MLLDCVATALASRCGCMPSGSRAIFERRLCEVAQLSDCLLSLKQELRLLTVQVGMVEHSCSGAPRPATRAVSKRFFARDVRRASLLCAPLRCPFLEFLEKHGQHWQRLYGGSGFPRVRRRSLLCAPSSSSRRFPAGSRPVAGVASTQCPRRRLMVDIALLSLASWGCRTCRPWLRWPQFVILAVIAGRPGAVEYILADARCVADLTWSPSQASLVPPQSTPSGVATGIFRWHGPTPCAPGVLSLCRCWGVDPAPACQQLNTPCRSRRCATLLLASGKAPTLAVSDDVLRDAIKLGLSNELPLVLKKALPDVRTVVDAVRQCCEQLDKANAADCSDRARMIECLRALIEEGITLGTPVAPLLEHVCMTGNSRLVTLLVERLTATSIAPIAEPLTLLRTARCSGAPFLQPLHRRLGVSPSEGSPIQLRSLRLQKRLPWSLHRMTLMLMRPAPPHWSAYYDPALQRSFLRPPSSKPGHSVLSIACAARFSERNCRAALSGPA